MKRFCFVSAFIGFGFGMLFLSILTILIHSMPEYTRLYSWGYKQGQIDSMTNNIKYELVMNPDKTSEWKEIKK